MRSRLGGALGLALAVACGGQERSGNPNSDNTGGSPNVTLTFINPAGGAGGDICGTAMTDGLGNLYIDNRDPVPSLIFSLPLASGFATLGRGMTSNRFFAGFAPDGTALFSTSVSLAGPYGER